MRYSARAMIICLVAGLVFLAGSAPAAAGNERAAAAIWQRIQAFLDDERELAACRLAKELAHHADTAVYARAKAELLKRGISIETPLKSYTIKRIFDLQNLEEARRRKTGSVPSPGARSDFLDGWDNPLRIESISKPLVLYLIRSAGPDRRFYTNDDLMIPVRMPRHLQPQERAKGKGHLLPGATTVDPAERIRQQGRSSLYKSPRKPTRSGGGSSGDILPGDPAGSPSSPPPGGPTERRIDIQDLLRK